MLIAFRVDASLQIGTGHVTRCLTLADEMRQRGERCYFVCRPHDGHLLDMISQRGHQVMALPALKRSGEDHKTNNTAHGHWLGTDWQTDAKDTQEVIGIHMKGKVVDWLVVDHYALAASWEQMLRPQTRRILVIDDLADRSHACDLLLDQNLGRKEDDYSGLLECGTTTLIGPQHALLRPEFAVLRTQSLARRKNNPQFRSLLITMGGVDMDNATGQVLDVLKACVLPADLRITVVMGPHAPWLARVKEQAALMPWGTEVLVGVNNMAELMAESDLAIGAAGSTSWERCCLGLPSLVLVLADNQLSSAIALQDAGASIAIQKPQQLLEIFDANKTSVVYNELLAKLSQGAARVTDGWGCSRVVDHMLESFDA